MFCARACPLPKIIIQRVQKNAQNSYICTFVHINIDESNTVVLSCDFKLITLVPCATEAVPRTPWLG